MGIMTKPVYCYMILCENKSFYTGWTTDLEMRFKQHKNGKGSRYTRLNKPLKLVYWETCKDKSSALKREKEIKKLTRKGKETLINSWQPNLKLPDEFLQYDYLSVAPGRVNILGEHIDYNGGFVLPAAIDRYVYLAANPNENNLVTITALDLNETVSFIIDELERKTDIHGKSLPAWALYPAGVLWASKKHQLKLTGFEGVFTSTIPIGAGLSSSAALEVSFAAMMREFCDWDIDNLDLAKICQLAENQFVGVNCGLMDQFTSANGIENALLLFNTSTYEWRSMKLPEDLRIIVTNSKISHSLASSAYNERRKSCEEALEIIKQRYPEKENLCQMSVAEFDEIESELNKILWKRTKHVVEECGRVTQAIDYLKNDQIIELGLLIRESHTSLRDFYEVSIPEIDLLVSIANNIPGNYGSRIMGAGFGGSIVSLVDKKHETKFIKNLEQEYTRLTGNIVESFVCKTSNGVKVLWRDKI